MLSQALEHEGQSLMDVAVNRQELLVLPSINLAQIKGLILYMIKAVLNGKEMKSWI
jgi:pyruvate dehydrogenase (quinone)